MLKSVVSEGPSQTAAAATNTQESVIALISYFNSPSHFISLNWLYFERCCCISCILIQAVWCGVWMGNVLWHSTWLLTLVSPPALNNLIKTKYPSARLVNVPLFQQSDFRDAWLKQSMKASKKNSYRANCAEIIMCMSGFGWVMVTTFSNPLHLVSITCI